MEVVEAVVQAVAVSTSILFRYFAAVSHDTRQQKKLGNATATSFNLAQMWNTNQNRTWNSSASGDQSVSNRAYPSPQHYQGSLNYYCLYHDCFALEILVPYDLDDPLIFINRAPRLLSFTPFRAR